MQDLRMYYTEHGSCWWILFGCKSSGRMRDNVGQSLLSSLSGFPGYNNIYWAIGLRDTYYSSVGIQFLMFDWNGIYTRYHAARCLCHLSAIYGCGSSGRQNRKCILTQYTVWEHLHLFTIATAYNSTRFEYYFFAGSNRFKLAFFNVRNKWNRRYNLSLLGT